MSAPAQHDGGEGASGPRGRRRRDPTPSELALLRWLAAKPRPVAIGPIGNCVRRGWAEPVRAVVDDFDGRRLGIVYVVTEAGSRIVERHAEGTGGRGRPGSGDPESDLGPPDGGAPA